MCDGSPVQQVENSVHILDDGNYCYEVEGLPIDDPEEHLYPNAKKPTRIRFSTSPIKVFSTYSIEDYDRKNEDVDPMAASAEYELEKRVERMDIFPVELEKGPDGLGLSIIGMGVGADAGLEKLGIFIKTLTEGGAAQKDGRIKVNDQIIEVDGKSLVGVTQAYAASVLRNTSGKVSFLIGREKNPQNSEVARLIQQSIEQDKRRADQRRQELEERQRELELQEDQSPEQELEEEPHSTFAPPLPEIPPPSPLPSNEDDDDIQYEAVQSPEAESPQEAIEVFDLAEESSSESVTPEMDPQVLFIKLKEAQYKNAVSEAELAKVRARMILLENSDAQCKHYERKCEDMAARLRESERTLQSAQKEVSGYQDLLEGSQGQYISLEKKLREDVMSLEKKYHKAKKLIKEYQQRENELVEEREGIVQQQTEKEQQYNGLVKTLKDRVMELEHDLGDALRAAGLPPLVAKDSLPRDVELVTRARPPKKLEVKPVPPAAEELSEVSSESDMSSPEISPDLEKPPPVTGRLSYRPPSTKGAAPQPPQSPPHHLQNGGSAKRLSREMALNAVPQTELLDTSANKDKGALGNSGALANRRPPTKHPNSNISTEEEDEEDDMDQPFAQHDRDNQSDTSSLSQTSYDPAQPRFSDISGEIPDAIPTHADDSGGGVMLISSKPRGDPVPTSSGRSFFSTTSSSKSNNGGVALLSKKPRFPQDSGSMGSLDSGGITLISRRTLDTGYSPATASLNALNTTSGMVGEYDLESRSQSYDFASAKLTVDEPADGSVAHSKRGQQYQSSPVHEWSVQQVCHWLLAINMDHYAREFIDKKIDGSQLLQLDGNRLKLLGISNSNDRNVMKKKIKDLRSAIEREKKQHEKEQRAREKLEKQAVPKKKKSLFGK